MKDATRAGMTAKTRKEEKEAITEEEEELFWEKGLLGNSSSKALLNTVYSNNRKLFGLRGGEHRNIGKLFATQALSQTPKNVSEPQTGIEPWFRNIFLSLR